MTASPLWSAKASCSTESVCPARLMVQRKTQDVQYACSRSHSRERASLVQYIDQKREEENAKQHRYPQLKTNMNCCQENGAPVQRLLTNQGRSNVVVCSEGKAVDLLIRADGISRSPADSWSHRVAREASRRTTHTHARRRVETTARAWSPAGHPP